jgi:hypothetical protein
VEPVSRAAIAAVNGMDIDGRPIKADEARERTERRSGGGDRPPRRDRW